MATAAAAPFFIFTLPAGAVADIVNRRAVVVSALLWQGACSALLAIGAWTRVIHPISVLACIFALGIGLAFSAPVMGAIVPDIVDTEELPSAITLGGVQMNLAGIVGPALGGLLLPLIGAPLLISINALMFLVVAFAVMQWKPRQTESTTLRENFTESFISSLRYARHSQHMKVILFRNLLFSLVISIVPALLPVIALKEMHLSASQLGLCLYVRGRRVPDRSSVRTPVPQGANLAECDHLDLYGDIGRGAACDVSHASSARFDDVRNTCGRGLRASGIRALGGWTARDAGMGARTNEFVPDHVRTGRFRDRGTGLGLGSGECRSQFDLCCCGCFRPDGVGSRASILN
jgi:protein-S-isoprenylcysteine O-methyltransferase Ste14